MSTEEVLPRAPATQVVPLVLHDYLVQRGGAERVALTMATHLGAGRITTSAYDPAGTFPGFRELDVTELSPHLPSRARASRLALAPVAALAFARLRVEAEVVLCSSSGWSHWTPSTSPTVVYCYTPPRWFWAQQDYFHDVPRLLRPAVASVLGSLRAVDRSRALTRGRYVAISSVVRDRIRDAYGVDAEVVHPPLALDVDGPVEPVPGVEPGFVLTVARDRGYKNVNTARRVFGAGGLGQLVVVGEGAPRAADRGRIVSTGRVSDAQLRWLYRSCRGVLALSHEDFGLTPVEGHAFGRPTVALRAGGYLDTCVEGVNAVFTDDLADASVRRAVQELDGLGADPGTVAATAERFSLPTFLASMSRVLGETAASS